MPMLSSGLQYENPPYQISNGNQKLGLGVNAIGITAHHLNGELQYNTHNLYGLSEAAVPHPAVANITGKRPFVLSRHVATLASWRPTHETC